MARVYIGARSYALFRLRRKKLAERILLCIFYNGKDILKYQLYDKLIIVHDFRFKNTAMNGKSPKRIKLSNKIKYLNDTQYVLKLYRYNINAGFWDE